MSEFWQIFLLLVAVGTASVTYWLQKRIDRQNELVSIKREQYQKYVSLVSEMVGHKKHEDEFAGKAANFEIVKMRLQLICLAPDEIVRAIADVAASQQRLFGLVTEDNMSLFKGDLSRLIRLMREDCFGKTNLTNEDLQGLIPFTVVPPVVPESQ